MCQLSEETIEKILSAGRIYEVGGAVRDRYLPDRSVKDRDYLVTGVSYDDLTRLLRQFGRVDLVGRSFGIIKFTQNRKGQPYTFDIALPRKEISTGTGHRDFHVDFDPSLPVEADLKRRDFTINAMAIALDSEELIDPLGGMDDLKDRRLRMISEQSFIEDPLRMLRAIQFSARFDFDIEPQTLAALKENVELICSVAPERISEELNKLLEKAEKPSHGFRLMQATGLLKQIIPELETCVGVDQPGGYHKYDVFEHTIRCVDACPPRLHVRLAALFHDITKPHHKRLTDTGASFYGHESSGARVAKKVLSRLRYSKEMIKKVQVLTERHMFTTDVTDKGLRRLVRKVGQDLIFDLLDLRRADVTAQGMGGTTDDVDQFERDIRAELEKKPPFGVSDLAVDGNDLMEVLDLEPSPMVGKILNELLEHVLDSPQDNTREQLIELARTYYDERKYANDRQSDEESD